MDSSHINASRKHASESIWVVYKYVLLSYDSRTLPAPRASPHTSHHQAVICRNIYLQVIRYIRSMHLIALPHALVIDARDYVASLCSSGRYMFLRKWGEPCQQGWRRLLLGRSPSFDCGLRGSRNNSMLFVRSIDARASIR